MSQPEGIKFPVRMTQDAEILDADGQVVVPSMIWASDHYHKSRQRERCKWIADTLNEAVGMGETGGEEKIALETKRKGRR